MKRLVVVAVAVLGAGCSEDPTAVGSWQSSLIVVDKKNAMEVADDGHGTALLHIQMTEMGQRKAGPFGFELRWETSREDRYEIHMRCQSTPFGACEPEDDFLMQCSLEGEGAALDCSGDGRWKDYDFGWIRLGGE
jgi:hypothetical protein